MKSLERLVEDFGLVRLGSGEFELALLLFAAEGFPVTGQLEQCDDGFGRLCTNAEPVLRAVRDDGDDRRLCLGVVGADLFDDAAVALGARVGDNDAIERGADFTHPL